MNQSGLHVHPDMRGLIFDLDGTIVDTMPLHYRAWRYALNTYGINFSEREFYAYAGMPTHVIIDTLGERHDRILPEDRITQSKDSFFLSLLDEISVIETVFSLVRRWHSRLPMGIGTGGRRVIVDRTMHILDIRKYFDAVVTVEDVVRPKPHTDTFIHCARLLGVNPLYCQVFEDGDKGLQAARDAGMMATDIRPHLGVPRNRNQ